MSKSDDVRVNRLYYNATKTVRICESFFRSISLRFVVAYPDVTLVAKTPYHSCLIEVWCYAFAFDNPLAFAGREHAKKLVQESAASPSSRMKLQPNLLQLGSASVYARLEYARFMPIFAGSTPSNHSGSGFFLISVMLVWERTLDPNVLTSLS